MKGKRCEKDVVRETLWERRKKDVGWIFVDVLDWFPLFFRFSTVVEVAEDLISFTDLLVFIIFFNRTID